MNSEHELIWIVLSFIKLCGSYLKISNDRIHIIYNRYSSLQMANLPKWVDNNDKWLRCYNRNINDFYMMSKIWRKYCLLNDMYICICIELFIIANSSLIFSFRNIHISKSFSVTRQHSNYILMNKHLSYKSLMERVGTKLTNKIKQNQRSWSEEQELPLFHKKPGVRFQ